MSHRSQAFGLRKRLVELIGKRDRTLTEMLQDRFGHCRMRESRDGRIDHRPTSGLTLA